MAKRFTDTEKWGRPWFRKLPPKYKCFWEYLRDQCDQIGVWYVDFELASMFIGETIDQSEAIQFFSKQIKVFGDGSRWFIPSFIPFQYGDLVPNNNLHRSLIRKLELIGFSGAIEPLPSPSAGVMDKVKEKEEYISLSLGEGAGRGEGKRFQKPNPKEVTDYALTIGFILDGNHFCDYYESKGWRIGKDPMKSWKAAVRTWKNNQGGKNGTTVKAGATPVPGKYDHLS